MAVKQLDLTINTSKGEQNLKRLHQFAKQVESVFGNINKLKINVKADPAQKALEKLNAQIKEGQDLINKFNQGAGLTAFGSKISAVTEQVGLIKKAFNDATTATERQRAATAILAGDFKKLTMEATAFANATDKRRNKGLILGNVGETIKEIEKFPKTILAGKNAMSMLNSMLEVVNVNSQEFKDINEAIGRQLEKNAEIQNKINTLNGSSKQQQTDKKKQERLKEQERTKKRIKALNEQTLNIENRIKNSIISKVKKEELTNNLKRVGVEIDRKELDLARQINIETQRNLTMEEKIQGRKNRIAQSVLIGGGFPLLFGASPAQAIGGALGGGIGEAISPGGGFAGSIAVTAAVNAVQQVFTSTIELSKALKTTSGTMDLMSERTLFSSDAIEKQAKALQDQGKEAELAALLTDELTKALGPGGLGNLDKLAENSREMARQFGILKTNMELFIAGPLANLISILNKQLGRANLRSNISENLKAVRTELGDTEFNKRMAEIQKFMTTGEKLNSIMTPSPFGLKDVGGGGPFSLQPGLNLLGVTDLNRLAEIEKISRRGLKPSTLPFQSNLDTTNGKSSSTKDFSQFEIDILNQRIVLQKTSGSLLDEEVVKIKQGIIFAESALKLAQAEGDAGEIAVIQKERLFKLNQLDLEVEKAKGKAFAENVLKPQMDAIAKKEQADFDAGAVLGRRLAAEVKIFNNLDKQIQKMQLLSDLENAKTVEQRANIQLKLHEIDLGQEIHEINRQDILDLLTKKERYIENNKLLKEQKQITKDIKNLLATEMSTAIKGLITGANSLNDAFKNVLNKMADAFLNIGLFGNVAGNLTEGGGLLGNLFGGLLATGGTAKAGKSYIVGESGPEMFTPGVTGTVTPNHALGGTTNVVVNVDASGSSVQGDDQSATKLGELIGAAVQSEIVKQKMDGGLLS